MGLDTIGQIAFSEAHDADARGFDFRYPVLGADGDPNPAWQLVGPLMKGQCRNQADDSLGRELGDLDQPRMKVWLAVGQLVQSPPIRTTTPSATARTMAVPLTPIYAKSLERAGA